jgi:Concanavalin A-like lectin/glucanases superfamily
MIPILVLLCLLAASNSAIAAQLNWAGADANWFFAGNWGGAVPTSGDWAAIQPGYTQPIIDGDAACSPLDIEPWSGGGLSSVDVNSGTLDFGSALNCATWGTFDTNAPGFSPGILYVHGGTVTTQSPGSAGLVIGSQYAPTVGRVIMYGGLISVPRTAIQHGDIALYGGTLETVGDGNFVFFLNFPENKIDISGGTLKLIGSDPTIDVTTLTNLITAGRIYSSRGVIGSPVFDVNYTSITSTDVNYCTWNPTPVNGATNVRYYNADGNSITLSWSESTLNNIDANDDIYFGTSFADVNTAVNTTVGIYKGSRNDDNGDPCSFTIKDPNKFSPNTTYYWRVDENSVSDGFKKGMVWSFTTHNGKAYNPKPVDDVNAGNALSEPLQLSWTAGDWTQPTGGHRVYFGTSYTSILNASTGNNDGRYRGTVSDPNYPLSRLMEKGAVLPGASYVLTPGTPYFWRIDEMNGATQVGGKGPVWGFTPAAYFNIDDFETYSSTDDINLAWPNHYVVSGCGLGSFGDSGRILVQDSTGKYMRFSYYGNTPSGMNFSEAKRPYTCTSFTGNGFYTPSPKALRVDYRGYAVNSADPVYDRMYVAIEDTVGNIAILENPDPNAQLNGNWTSWYTALKDINSLGTPSVVSLEAISGFAIGFGVRCNNYDAEAGDGNVMFDNIRLYAATCVPQYGPKADLDGDCDVDINDLSLLANDWLKHADNFVFSPYTLPHKAPILWYKFEETGAISMAQDSGTGDANNYVGTINNWSAMNWKVGGGRDGNNCLYLPAGRNSYVSCPTLALSFMSDPNHATDGGGITFSTWINADLTASSFNGWVYGFIVVKDVNGNDAVEIACPHHWSPTDWSANNAWAGWAKNGNPGFSLGPSTVPANYGGRWNHWAFVKAPHTVSWYCNGTLLKQEADTDANAGDPNIYGPLFPVPASAFTIGLGGWGGNWAGYIDDFQVYDYDLSAAEVAYLATDGTGHLIVPLISTANINTDGSVDPQHDPNQKVNFGDIAIMGKQWHTQILWP